METTLSTAVAVEMQKGRELNVVIFHRRWWPTLLSQQWIQVSPLQKMYHFLEKMRFTTTLSAVAVEINAEGPRTKCWNVSKEVLANTA